MSSFNPPPFPPIPPIPPVPPVPPNLGHVPPIFLRIPERLARWLADDLSAERAALLVQGNPSLAGALKGYRRGTLPEAKTRELLLQDFIRNVPFRIHVGNVWLAQRADDFAAIRGADPRETARNPAPWKDRLGLPALYWFCVFHASVDLQRLAQRLANDPELERDDWGHAPPEPAPEESALSSENKRLKAELKKAKDDADRVRTESAKLQASLARVQQRQEETEAELKKMRKARDAAEEAASKARAELSALRGPGSLRELPKLQKRLHMLERRLEESDRRRAELENDLRSQSEALRAALAASAEAERSLAALFRAHHSAPARKKSAAHSILILSDGESLPSGLREAAGSAGLHLFHHGLGPRNAELERKLERADRVILLLRRWEDLKSLAELTGYLRKRKADWLVLPPLPPALLLQALDE